MQFNILEVNNQKEFDEVVKELGKTAKTAYDMAFEYAKTLCPNKEVLAIVTDWWGGICISTEEYILKYSEKDNYEAHGIVMELISMGFG